MARGGVRTRFAPTPTCCSLRPARRRQPHREGLPGAIFVTGQHRHRRGDQDAGRAGSAQPSRPRRAPATRHLPPPRELGRRFKLGRVGAPPARRPRACARIEVCCTPTRTSPRRSNGCWGGCRGGRTAAAMQPAQAGDRMRDCDLMLSDFRRGPERAPALGVPLLVLRQKTERPEALWAATCGWSGPTPASPRHRAHLLGDPVALAAMSVPCLPLATGAPCYRIAALIEQWGRAVRRCLASGSSRVNWRSS